MQASKPSVTPSASMLLLLENQGLCRSIAANGEHYREILAQLQRDSVDEGNMESIGPVILALRKIEETILLFEARGKVIISQEKKPE